MKKIATTLLIVIAATIANAQTGAEIKKSYAEVNQYSGLYVFYFCKPVKEYEHIATIKKTFVVENTNEFLQKAASYSKKLHPDGEALIFNGSTSGWADYWDVVKFK